MKPTTLTIASLLAIVLLPFHIGGDIALGMPIIHRNNGFTPTVARSPGGLFFIWTLVALGVAGGLVVIFSARGLWRLRSRRT